MNLKSINLKDWAKFKEQILGNQPVKKQVSITEIEILSEDKIGLNGAEIPLSKQASADLRSIIGLPTKFSKDVDKNFGVTARKQIIDMCKLMRSASGKDLNVTLVLNPKSRQIERIAKEDRMLSMETFFQTFENLANQHDLEVKEFGTCSDGGINLSVVSSKSEFQVGNFADEIFHPGMTFKNNMNDGSYIMPFMYRLVCTNGMVNQSFGSADKTQKGSGPIQLGGEDFKSMDLFYQHIEHFVKGGFFPETFKNKISVAKNTMASLSEVESAGRMILDNSNAKDNQIDNFVPLNDIRSQYKSLGVDPKFLSAEQMKTSRTNVSIWDIVNGITDFASHDYGFEVSADNKLRLQVGAGNVLAKNSFDTQNLMNIHLPNKSKK